ncbi:MAG: hypothetical protein K2O16_04490 [Lachnospiraceae bacterium]|nr:hypothetical protein [Lachnospiraceae bacterium]
MERNILMGIDMGTTSLRVGFYDKDGKNYGFCAVDYELIHPHNTWVEQRAGDWILALSSAVKEGMDRFHIRKEQILGLSIGSTCCSVVVCDRNGKTHRNCIMWMDIRAAREAEEIAGLTGEHLSAEWMPCKLLWLKKYEPEIYRKAEVFCECQDYLTWFLTGKWSVNINTACNWGYNADKKGFPSWFYDKIGLPDAIERFPTDNCYAVGDLIGTLSKTCADKLGLLPDTLVAQGGVDSSIGILGMGVYEEGRVALMTGSSNLTMLLTKKMMFSESTINEGPGHLIKGYFTSFRGQLCSNSIIEWFRREIAKEGDAEGFFAHMEEAVKKVPVGSRGLLMLDYFQGNRHPYYDTRVRGMIYGLSLEHTQEDIYRSILESISYGTENLLEQYRRAGFPVEEINISGGSTNSDVFMQIQADVSNVRINVPEDCQSVCMGAAICVTVAAGIYESLPEAVKHMVRYRKVIEPNQDNHKIYRAYFKQYQQIYPVMKEWMHKTSDLWQNGGNYENT